MFLDKKEKKILELKARRKIYEVVREFAGCHFREIERKSNLSTGLVRYHLSFLAKQGLIKEDKDKNKKLLGLLRQKSVREIVLFILAHSDCNHEQIVQTVKVSPSTVSWHLKKLIENKIITYVKIGRKTNYKLLIDEEDIIKLLTIYK